MKSPVTTKQVDVMNGILAQLGDVGVSDLSVLLNVGFDVVVLLDRFGIVEQVQIVSDELQASRAGSPSFTQWRGKALTDLVLPDSRAKIVELLRVTALEGASRWRQVNAIVGSGPALPFALSAAKIGRGGREGQVLLVLRDLQATSRLQQQLVDAQQRLESIFDKQRFAETRQSVFFQIASEPMLVVEESTLRVIESNGAAQELFVDPIGSKKAPTVRDRQPKLLLDHFDAASRSALQAWLARLAREPNVGRFIGQLKTGGGQVSVRATLIRQQEGQVYLMTISVPKQVVSVSEDSQSHDMVTSVFDGMPDALVVSDVDGRVVTANQAFADMVQVASSEQIRGQYLARWLSRGEVDVSVLAGTLKQHQTVRQYLTDVRGEHGMTVTVEIAGVMRSVNGQACYGLAIRDVARRVSVDAQNDGYMPRRSDELRELVGRVPLKDIVSETSDLIERLCIESALELTGDNRAAAAEMLGLSRQSLYVKLRRYGVGYNDPNADESASADAEEN
jgi:transcriptional regulator PpsR